MDMFYSQLNLNPMIFLAVGGLLAFIGFIMIVKKGITLVFWSLLLLLGMSAVNYGLKWNTIQLSPDVRMTLGNIMEPGKEITKDAMKGFCADFVAEKPGSPAWCQEKQAMPKFEWSANDAIVFAKQCAF